MGLVQSQSSQADELITIDGFSFTIEKRLKSMIPTYGNVVVDFKKALFGEMFSVRFHRQDSCSC